jgi:transcriptional regulator with XRE-family HTH domain
VGAIVESLSSIARELRVAREKLKRSREQLAERIGYTASYIEKIELGKVPVTEGYLTAALPVLAEGIDVTATFGRLRQDALRQPVISEWLRPWLHIEEQADTLRWYKPLLVPGLLQVDGYARALLTTEDEVKARMARQAVFSRDEQPEVVAVIGEHVLHDRVGAPEIMAEQLAHLAQIQAVVQVLPADTDSYYGRDGSFVLATVREQQYVYVDSPARGFTLEDREIISRVQRAWEAIRGEALTPRQSHEVILKAAERWKSQN